MKENAICLTTPDNPTYAPRPSINLLLESIAENSGSRAIGIILSGTGSDGARGIRAIKAEGGFTLVQDPESAKYDGMPNAAIQTANIDFILPPAGMAKELQALYLYPERVKLSQDEHKDPDLYRNILSKIKDVALVDFSLYKTNTIKRRIERRMAMLKISSLTEYNNFLQKNRSEVTELFKNILIGVTSFFRDSEVFELVHTLLAQRLKSKSERVFRAWIPGCSTGEEAYTIAILISEILGEDLAKWKVQIFATDIDEDALAIGRRAIYSESALMGIDTKLLGRYFQVSRDEFVASKGIREMIIFSRHNLISDPPFLRLDFVTCRNLLIYFNAELQQKVFPTFHYALNSHGLMLLGKSESIGQFQNYFKTIDARWRVYEANYLGTKTPIAAKAMRLTQVPRYIEPKVSSRKQSLEELLAEKFRQHIMPSCVLINDMQNIIYSSGNNPYLIRPEGEPNDNIVRNLHPRLANEMRAALSQVELKQELFKTPFIEIHNGEKQLFVRLTVTPVDKSDEQQSAILVCFQEEGFDTALINSSRESGGEEKDERYRALEDELNRTREQMQTLVEELETSNEELQSMNEELQSANEELQSTNEELETTNEELQSTNEELQTAYSELRSAFDEKDEQNLLLAKARGELESINQQYQLAQQVAQIGHFVWEFKSDWVQWSQQLFHLLDYPSDETSPSL
ncbi:MAG: hypothetical protein HQL48_11990, partial [Gammaproteobacteria bacterium]|nr:hypothetical protein [Gammaproteobacteria bacterium]